MAMSLSDFLDAIEDELGEAMTLVPRERLLLCDRRPVALTPKAFDLLVHFAGNPRRLLYRYLLCVVALPGILARAALVPRQR